MPIGKGLLMPFCAGVFLAHCFLCFEPARAADDDGGSFDFAISCDPFKHLQPNIGLTEDPGANGCPSGMVRVGTFCIDRFEASLQVQTAPGQWQPWSPYFNPEDRVVRAVSLRRGVPQGYINGGQAMAACRRSGKRLCSRTEWVRACQGTKHWTYPYGPKRISKACNDERDIHPAVELFPNTPDPFRFLDHPCLNQLLHGLARSAEYSKCQTPDGVFDLMGNLHEWVWDQSGTFRGGYYVDTSRNGEGCDYRTTAHDFEYWDYSTGFRCCAELVAPRDLQQRKPRW